MLNRILVGAALLLGSPCLLAQTVVGLGPSNTLVRFSAIAPAAVSASMPITGINGGDTLVGLDVRPSNGLLYAVAASGRIYTIDPASGAATAGAQIAQAMTGTVFGVDFNPAADRLRVVSDTGQNLRINVTDGATTVDGAINPAGRIIGEVAYTNSAVGPAPASTQLYDIDLASNSLLLQNPPNDGTTVLVGSLGVVLDAGAAVAIDIRTVGAVNTAYAALRVGGVTSLYTVSLTTGAATLIGPIGGNPMLRGITVVGAAVTPGLPANATALGLRGGNAIVRFPASSPSGPVTVATLSGLAAGDTLIGIDYRPANGLLYGVSGTGHLYTIDPVSGVAVQGATLSVLPTGTRFAFDFNPAADRLRLVSDTGQNLRIDVSTGATTVDGSINPAGPQITAVGYTNSVAGTTTTTLFDIDAVSSSLFVQNPPNNGTLQLVGPLGVVPTGDSGLDIYSANGNNAAFAALQVGGTSGFYSIDLGTGAASLIGAIGGNPTLTGLAISPNALGVPAVNVPVPVDSRLALLLLALGVFLTGAFALRRAS
ncbi:MAG: DUF4394 domain-containing protein [Dokdonella sp.]